MELKEFVTSAILGVINGVQDAKKMLGDYGAHVNPQLSTQQGELQKMGRQVSTNGLVIHLVEFDVAVAVMQSSSGASEQSVGVVSHTGPSTTTSSTGHNRMKFSVPITLP